MVPNKFKIIPSHDFFLNMQKEQDLLTRMQMTDKTMHISKIWEVFTDSQLFFSIYVSYWEESRKPPTSLGSSASESHCLTLSSLSM